ncbi:PREDICTED: heavy metal-associated isoprenylated plant protein 7-like [Nicotiana attenuata]|uniref:Heavy metal-associated isoprenylated plant protein 3 n=1 Tax=Nicotiana attenuata TaxID=49451 RepID=A0A314KI18_NICAT|nr:PREDICTED: heavy metal-associated isoprenylated plant protein 7-like [Nicotiana attenuata]OIT28973.1 heavy metal-associated isoprenylated plant protein 3 [Nicotiana attenuata]
MGEEKENKGEEKKEEEKKVEEKKEEEKKEDEAPQEIVLKVDMHCEACARKVARSLKGFQGVEEVTADCKASKVVVKGKNADPLKVFERVKKKSGRKVELISPLPKPTEDKKDEKKEEPPKEEKKDEPPPVITVKLIVQMHCDACAQALQKRIRKIQGVESVTTDLGNNQVVVKGVVDPEKLVSDVYKRTGKQAIVVKEEEKKEEEKKEEEKKEKEEEKKGNEQEESKGEDDKTTTDIKKNEYLHPKDYIYMEYANYPPQIFSDENPHACSLM